MEYGMLSARQWIGNGKRLLKDSLAPLLLDSMFPPHCPSCRMETDIPHTLCAECFSKTRFLTAPFCACCGHPFPYAMGDNALCAKCLERLPPYDRARSALRYDEITRPLVTRLKYADQTGLAPYGARLLYRAGGELFEDADWLIPVPMHWRRLAKRRFNQSALLARALSKLCGVNVLPQGLRRVRATTPQAGLSYRRRQANLRRAFAVGPGMESLIQERHIVLIDDVMTTGATIEACVKTLRKANPATVSVLTLTRRLLEET